MIGSGGWGTKRFKAVNTCHPEAKHYARGLCKNCYRRLPEFKAMRQAYYKAHREQWKAHGERARNLRIKEQKLYGLSREDQEQMLEAQGHLCALCRRPPGRKRLSVDHDHKTGQVRGMLCGPCNTALGLLQDSPEMCERAANYLRDATLLAATAAA